jgi:glycosyltransferase involved in cell wall biosynthesis
MINKKLKIAVYTITKNEEKFIERYCISAKNADQIFAFDTGSTDKTVEIAKKFGALVYPIYVSPWRFDVARNTSLAMLPPDIDVCIALDADEILMPGWREEIESLWNLDTTRMSYLFDWSQDLIFTSNKIHSRHGYLWKFPCHETLVADPRTKENFVFTDKLLVRHLPDPNKSRGQYLDLLEITVKEYPTETRHAFFYARELIFYNKFDDAIKELKKYLAMPNAKWSDERAYAMRLLGSIYKNLDNQEESIFWFVKGTKEAPHRKESWFALAEAAYDYRLWDKLYEAGKGCISAPSSVQWPVDPRVEGALPYDYAALGAHLLGNKTDAIKFGQRAIELAPNDERIQKNMIFYKAMPDN